MGGVGYLFVEPALPLVQLVLVDGFQELGRGGVVIEEAPGYEVQEVVGIRLQGEPGRGDCQPYGCMGGVWRNRVPCGVR